MIRSHDMTAPNNIQRCELNITSIFAAIAHKSEIEANVRIPPKLIGLCGVIHVRGSSRSIPISPPSMAARMSPIKFEESINKK